MQLLEGSLLKIHAIASGLRQPKSSQEEAHICFFCFTVVILTLLIAFDNFYLLGVLMIQKQVEKREIYFGFCILHCGFVDYWCG